MSDTTKKTTPVHYPRNAANSQLTTKKTYLDYITDLETQLDNLEQKIDDAGGDFEVPIEMLNERTALKKKLDNIHDRENELRRKEFDYNCGYSFLFDGIAVLCTDYNEKIEILENNYYMVRVRPEMLEQICLGEYAANTKIKATFWKEFIRVAKEPKTLVMNTDEGTYQGEPIRLLVYHKDGTQGRDFSTLGTKGQDLTVLKNTSGNPIDYIQIEFFTPMFRAVVDYQKNWIPLPRNLQALLYSAKENYPNLFSFTFYNSKTGKKETYNLSIDTIRKYFLYVTGHNNNIGDNMKINAIEFFKQVKPSEIKDGNRLQNWYKGKCAMDSLCYLHRTLVNDNLLKGIQFNTGKVFYNPTEKQFTINVKRDKPLELPADPPQEIAFEIKDTPAISWDDTDVPF